MYCVLLLLVLLLLLLLVVVGGDVTGCILWCTVTWVWWSQCVSSYRRLMIDLTHCANLSRDVHIYQNNAAIVPLLLVTRWRPPELGQNNLRFNAHFSVKIIQSLEWERKQRADEIAETFLSQMSRGRASSVRVPVASLFSLSVIEYLRRVRLWSWSESPTSPNINNFYFPYKSKWDVNYKQDWNYSN